MQIHQHLIINIIRRHPRTRRRRNRRCKIGRRQLQYSVHFWSIAVAKRDHAVDAGELAECVGKIFFGFQKVFAAGGGGELEVAERAVAVGVVPEAAGDVDEAVAHEGDDDDEGVEVGGGDEEAEKALPEGNSQKKVGKMYEKARKSTENVLKCTKNVSKMYQNVSKIIKSDSQMYKDMTRTYAYIYEKTHNIS